MPRIVQTAVAGGDRHAYRAACAATAPAISVEASRPVLIQLCYRPVRKAVRVWNPADRDLELLPIRVWKLSTVRADLRFRKLLINSFANLKCFGICLPFQSEGVAPDPGDGVAASPTPVNRSVTPVLAQSLIAICCAIRLVELRSKWSSLSEAFSKAGPQN